MNATDTLDTLILKIEDLREHDACGLRARIDDLRAHLGHEVDADEPIPLATWWALPSTSLADRLWSLRAAAPALEARRLGVRFATRCARRVLHLTRPQDRPVAEAAILAAEAWAADPTEANADAAHAAARAAFAATAAAADAADAALAARAALAAAAAADVTTAAVADVSDVATWATAAWATAPDLDAERDAQRADLDSLLAEVSR